MRINRLRQRVGYAYARTQSAPECTERKTTELRRLRDRILARTDRDRHLAATGHEVRIEKTSRAAASEHLTIRLCVGGDCQS